MLFIQHATAVELRAEKRNQLAKFRRSESRRGWLLAAMIPALLVGAGVLGAVTEAMPGRPLVLGAYILLMVPVTYLGVGFHARAEEKSLEASKELQEMKVLEP